MVAYPGCIHGERVGMTPTDRSSGTPYVLQECVAHHRDAATVIRGLTRAAAGNGTRWSRFPFRLRLSRR